MSLPKISVILTSFNHAKYLREAIDSVLSQTFSDFELIIWDDASADDSWAIIQSYKDSRIKAYKNDKQRRGIYGINKAISDIARGEYIAIHHSDDVWMPEKLERQINYLSNHPEVGAAFTWAKIIDENGVETSESWFNRGAITRWQWLHELFCGENHLNHPSVLVRKSVYESVGLYAYGFAQTADAEMWSRVLLNFDIYVVPEKLTLHRLFSDGSNTSGRDKTRVIRTESEWSQICLNYLKVPNDQYLFNIFGSLNKYESATEHDAKFLVAMACLSECNAKGALVLGIRLLFEVIQDPVSAARAKRAYSFDYFDLIKLTGTLDIFAVGTNYDAREAEVISLKEAVTWLTLQRDAWEKAAAEHEQSLRWMSSQRDAWEKTAAEHEQSLKRIASQRDDWEKIALEHVATLSRIRRRLGGRIFKLLSRGK